MRFNSLTLRLAAAAVLWSVLILIVGGLLQASLFPAYVERNFDARLQTYLAQMVSTTLVDEDGETAGPGLADPRFDQVLSGWYWQIGDAPDPYLRSPSLFQHVLEIPSDASAVSNDAVLTLTSGRELRFVSQRASPGGTDAFMTFTVAVDRAELATEASQFNNALIWSLRILGPWLLGLIVVGFVLFVVVQQRFGMRPLRDLGNALNNIRTGRATRIEGTYPVEIDPLARELNALLDQTDILVERARANAGDIAHMIKTPLSVLLNEAEQSEGPLADTVKTQVAKLRTQIDHQLARARMAAGNSLRAIRTEIEPVVEDLTRALHTIHRDRGVTISYHGDLDACFRGEREDLEEMLGNLLDNACKWSVAEVQITARRHGEDRLVITVDDNGPGLTPEECVEVLQRGKRLDETVPGSGLGLAIVADIAEIYGGSVTLGRAEMGGLRVILDLPAPE